MTKKELKANITYLESNGVSLSEDSVWSNFPDSRELYYATDAGGDFSIAVEEVSSRKVRKAIEDFDVNSEVMMWWESGKTPFSNIKDLYEDIDKWVDDLIDIADGMPY